MSIILIILEAEDIVVEVEEKNGIFEYVED